MTFKQFSAWCEDRACDGMWGMTEAIVCCDVVQRIYKKPFWKREKEWQAINAEHQIEKVVNATNKLIKEQEEGKKCFLL